MEIDIEEKKKKQYCYILQAENRKKHLTLLGQLVVESEAVSKNHKYWLDSHLQASLLHRKSLSFW